MSNKRIKPQRKKGKGRIDPPSDPGEKPPQQRSPIFCLQHLSGRYCLSKCDDSEKAAFADTLHRLSKLTWAEIAGSPRKGLGTEIISRASLKAPLPSHVTAEVNVLAFRCIANAPMIGYRDGRVFHVLFIDRDFTAYPHGS